MNGENVEPTPIEEALVESPLIDQARRRERQGKGGREEGEAEEEQGRESRRRREAAGGAGGCQRGGAEQEGAAVVGEASGSLLTGGATRLTPWQELKGLIPAGPRDPTPCAETLEKEAEELRGDKKVVGEVAGEANRVIRNSGRFREWERVGAVGLLLEPFTMENAMMTQTLKVKREAVANKYKLLLARMYGH
eukprot:717364-Hanusia_phi.AAC.1